MSKRRGCDECGTITTNSKRQFVRRTIDYSSVRIYRLLCDTCAMTKHRCRRCGALLGEEEFGSCEVCMVADRERWEAFCVKHQNCAWCQGHNNSILSLSAYADWAECAVTAIRFQICSECNEKLRNGRREAMAKEHDLRASSRFIPEKKHVVFSRITGFSIKK